MLVEADDSTQRLGERTYYECQLEYWTIKTNTKQIPAPAFFETDPHAASGGTMTTQHPFPGLHCDRTLPQGPGRLLLQVSSFGLSFSQCLDRPVPGGPTYQTTYLPVLRRYKLVVACRVLQTRRYHPVSLILHVLSVK